MKRVLYIFAIVSLFCFAGMASADEQPIGAQIVCGENMKEGIKEAMEMGASADEITKALIEKGCNPKAVIVAAIEAGGDPKSIAAGAREAGVLESVIVVALVAAEVDPNEVGFAYTPPGGRHGAPGRGARLRKRVRGSTSPSSP